MNRGLQGGVNIETKEGKVAGTPTKAGRRQSNRGTVESGRHIEMVTFEEEGNDKEENTEKGASRPLICRLSDDPTHDTNTVRISRRRHRL
jgi:hypothetical protein